MLENGKGLSRSAGVLVYWYRFSGVDVYRYRYAGSIRAGRIVPDLLTVAVTLFDHGRLRWAVSRLPVTDRSRVAAGRRDIVSRSSPRLREPDTGRSTAR